MRRPLIIAFLLMGFTFTVTQGLVIRAILVACGGNELLIGVVLGSWLLIEAMGSALAGRLATRVRFTASAFAGLQTILALLLPATIVAGFLAHLFTGALPGEGVGVGPAVRVTVLLLLPVGLVDGAMFAVGCVAGLHLADRQRLSAGAVYALEALGGIAGGVVLTYLLIPLSQPVRAALLLGVLNLVSALSLVRGRLARLLVAGMLLLTLGSLASPVADHLLAWAVAEQWVGHRVVAYADSVYGNVTVIQRESEYTFFVDGAPLFTTPNPDTARVEELVHLPLLLGPSPRRVLLLSGGIGGVLHEVLKYPVQSVDYAELDPLLIAEMRSFPTALTRAELDDPRVKVHLIDGRLLVREQAARDDVRYDLILMNLPYPTTLQVNRFFTVEFYRATRSLLTDQGLLVVPLPGSLTYLGPELTDLHNLVRQALGQAFPHVRPIPGETVLWLASPSPDIWQDDALVLVERWEAAGREARLITAPYIHYKFDPARAAWFQETLARGRAVPTNEDLHPAGVFYGLAYWEAVFAPELAVPFGVLAGLNLPLLVTGVLVAWGGLWVAGWRWPGLRRATVPIAVGTTGWGGMAADIIIILAFQTLRGHVYHQIGLLIAAFMAGLAAGGLGMNALLRRRPAGSRWLALLEAMILGFWLPGPGLLVVLAGEGAPGLVLPVLLLGNAGAGLLVGAEFPLANVLVNKRPGAASEPVPGSTAGYIYAMDLAGAFAGAIVVGVVLVPVVGMIGTGLLVATLKAGSLMLVATRS